MQIKDFTVDRNRRELTEHRTLVLPMACYETTIKENINGYIPLHWHEEIQFVVMKKGEARFQINEEKIILQEGEGLFINSGCLHMAEEIDNSGSCYICLNVLANSILPQELWGSYVQPFIQSGYFPYILLPSEMKWTETIFKNILEINKLIEEKPFLYEMDATAKSLVIWKCLVENAFHFSKFQQEHLNSDRLKQMLNWIHEHYTEKMRLDDIARAGKLSRSECCRYFKKILNKTPFNYVIEYRIQKSLKLLQEDDSNVTEVAYQVGFNSTSYFIEKFKQHMNMTPLAFKKKN